MAEKTADEYARELIEMYNRARSAEMAQSVAAEQNEDKFQDSTGGLQVIVTTLRRILPVEGAVVTVFTGENNNRTVIETDVTDNSGKSGVFKLRTPAKALSESAAAEGIPYALYNVEVKADGYVTDIYMNMPVFSGVVSVQNVDLLSIPAAGNNTAPRIFDERPDYDL